MLRNKYRPKSFKTFIGNEEVIASVQKQIGTAQLFLFHGEKGCGKTTLARIIANVLNIDEEDRYEVNASNKTGVDDARQMEEFANLLPAFGDKKIFIIDEVHRMTANAQDSLLKIFEEPPEHVVFVLCTTNPAKILPTVKSRAFEYFLKPLEREEIKKLLKRIIKKEKLEVNPIVLKAIIKASQGIPRNAITNLEKIVGMPTKKAVKLLRSGIDEDNSTVAEICKALVTGSPWKEVKVLIEEFKEEAEAGRLSFLGYLGGWADKTNVIEQMKRIHFIQGAFEDNTYDNGIVGLKRQIREAYLIGKNVI